MDIRPGCSADKAEQPPQSVKATLPRHQTTDLLGSEMAEPRLYVAPPPSSASPYCVTSGRQLLRMRGPASSVHEVRE